MRDVCPLESEILVALRRREWLPAWDEHLESCSSCRATAVVAGWLIDAARQEVPETLAEPATLLWKAQIMDRVRRRQERLASAERPLRIALVAGAVLLILGMAPAALVVRDSLLGWLDPALGGPAALGPALLAAALFASLSYSAVRLWSAAVR